MTTIAIFTTTRAEFGLFTPLLNTIEKSSDFGYKLFVGETHLKEAHGKTIHEIETHGFKITEVFDYFENRHALNKSLKVNDKQID